MTKTCGTCKYFKPNDQQQGYKYGECLNPKAFWKFTVRTAVIIKTPELDDHCGEDHSSFLDLWEKATPHSRNCRIHL